MSAAEQRGRPPDIDARPKGERGNGAPLGGAVAKSK